MIDCIIQPETTQNNITKTCEGLARLLVAKNTRYGNSALEPMRVFSRSDPAEGILVRLDDKLSRIKYASSEGNLLRSFNPRARGGRDLATQSRLTQPLVSIHAPAGGATLYCNQKG